VVRSVFLAAALALPAAAATTAADADRAVGEALAEGANPLTQARKLTELAWSQGRDDVIATRARRELVDFGGHSMLALREALNTVDPAYAEEILLTTMAAATREQTPGAQEYVPVFLDALWIDNHAARLRAIDGLVPVRSALAVQPMIDAALEDPTLAPPVVAALGAMRYDQARFYLEKVMMEGPMELRPVAAASLTQIGGAALGPLKNALQAPGRETRVLAARALLPAAGERELGALYDYIRDHGDDDPALTQALRGLTERIEQAIAARDAANAASGEKDF
jgi:hypothetical protein